MKIYIDMILFQLQKVGGASLVWYEILMRMNRDKRNIEYILQNNKCNNIFYSKIEKEMCSTYKEIFLPIKIIRYLPILKKIEHFSIVHSTCYRISLSKKAINITTVHDFTYEYYSRGLPRMVHSIQKGFAIKKSKGIICISESTKRDLIKFYPKINKDKIHVIYNGVGEEYKQLEQNHSISELGEYNNYQFILYVGERTQYKNFNFAVEIAKQLKMRMVIVGGKKLKLSENQLLEDMLMNNYIHLRGLTNEKLNAIYNRAFSLIYPSKYEGFGIPVLEAKRAGCPVIAYNCSSIPEVMGPSDFLMDNYDVGAWVSQLEKLYDLNYRMQVVLSGLEYSKKFSWEKTYRETWGCYEKIVVSAKDELYQKNTNLD